jgi:hypothetical protein
MAISANGTAVTTRVDQAASLADQINAIPPIVTAANSTIGAQSRNSVLPVSLVAITATPPIG